MKRAPLIIGSLVVLGLAAFVGYRMWRDPERCFRHALEAMQGGDLKTAEADIELLGSDPRYAMHQAFLRGTMLMQAGRPLEALEQFKISLDHPDLELQTLIVSGQAHYQLGSAGTAKLLWEKALALDPDAVDAHRWLGVLYYDLGAMDHAQTHLTRVSELDPDDPRPDRLMGLINKDYERPHIAIGHYRESLRRAPEGADVEAVRLELAECEVAQREFQPALETVRDCSPSVRKQVIEAACHLNLGDGALARRLIDQALDVAPRDLDALLLKGEILLAAGETAQAVDVLERAVEYHPHDFQARFDFAQALGRTDDKQRAEEQQAIADKIRDQWSDFWELHVKAIDQPTDAEARYQLGLLAQQLGRADLARNWLQAALAIDPTHAGAAGQLQQLSEAASPSPAAAD